MVETVAEVTTGSISPDEKSTITPITKEDITLLLTRGWKARINCSDFQVNLGERAIGLPLKMTESIRDTALLTGLIIAYYPEKLAPLPVRKDWGDENRIRLQAAENIERMMVAVRLAKRCRTNYQILQEAVWGLKLPPAVYDGISWQAFSPHHEDLSQQPTLPGFRLPFNEVGYNFREEFLTSYLLTGYQPITLTRSLMISSPNH